MPRAGDGAAAVERASSTSGRWRSLLSAGRRLRFSSMSISAATSICDIGHTVHNISTNSWVTSGSSSGHHSQVRLQIS